MTSAHLKDKLGDVVNPVQRGGMNSILRKVLILAAVLALGIVAGRATVATAPDPRQHELADQIEQTKRRLSSVLTDRELEEYRELKELRAKYEKADELLGKVLMVLIADLGLNVSKKNAQALEASAHGVHPRVEAAASSKPSQAPPQSRTGYVAPGTQVAGAPLPVPTPMSRASLPDDPRPQGLVPFDRIDRGVGGRRACDKNLPNWFISGASAQEYRVGIDRSLGQGDDQVAFIEGIKPSPRQQAELNHCAEVGALGGKRVKFTAWIKAEGVRDYANIHFRVDGRNRERALNERAHFNGTFDWKQLSVEADVPADATAIYYGITFESTGKAWIRHAAVTVVGP
jgi:hypothetical protein